MVWNYHPSHLCTKGNLDANATSNLHSRLKIAECRLWLRACGYQKASNRILLQLMVCVCSTLRWNALKYHEVSRAGWLRGKEREGSCGLGRAHCIALIPTTVMGSVCWTQANWKIHRLRLNSKNHRIVWVGRDPERSPCPGLKDQTQTTILSAQRSLLSQWESPSPLHSAVTANSPCQAEPLEKLVNFLLVCFGDVTAATSL